MPTTTEPPLPPSSEGLIQKSLFQNQSPNIESPLAATISNDIAYAKCREGSCGKDTNHEQNRPESPGDGYALLPSAIEERPLSAEGGSNASHKSNYISRPLWKKPDPRKALRKQYDPLHKWSDDELYSFYKVEDKSATREAFLRRVEYLRKKTKDREPIWQNVPRRTMLCGCASWVRFDERGTTITRDPCGTWRCPSCIRFLIRQEREKLQTVKDIKIFLTLTFDQTAEMATGWTAEDVEGDISNRTDPLFDRIRKDLDIDFEYYMAIESHKSGWPHPHVLSGHAPSLDKLVEIFLYNLKADGSCQKLTGERGLRRTTGALERVCPKCESTNIRSLKSAGWRCNRCSEKFLSPKTNDVHGGLLREVLRSALDWATHNNIRRKKEYAGFYRDPIKTVVAVAELIEATIPDIPEDSPLSLGYCISKRMKDAKHLLKKAVSVSDKLRILRRMVRLRKIIKEREWRRDFLNEPEAIGRCLCGNKACYAHVSEEPFSEWRATLTQAREQELAAYLFQEYLRIIGPRYGFGSQIDARAVVGYAASRRVTNYILDEIAKVDQAKVDFARNMHRVRWSVNFFPNLPEPENDQEKYLGIRIRLKKSLAAIKSDLVKQNALFNEVVSPHDSEETLQLDSVEPPSGSLYSSPKALYRTRPLMEPFRYTSAMPKVYLELDGRDIYQPDIMSEDIYCLRSDGSLERFNGDACLWSKVEDWATVPEHVRAELKDFEGAHAKSLTDLVRELEGKNRFVDICYRDGDGNVFEWDQWGFLRGYFNSFRAEWTPEFIFKHMSGLHEQASSLASNLGIENRLAELPF